MRNNVKVLSHEICWGLPIHPEVFNHSLNIAEETFLFNSLAPYMEDDSYIEYENETFIGNIKNIYKYKNFKVKHEVISNEEDNLSYF